MVLILIQLTSILKFARVVIRISKKMFIEIATVRGGLDNRKALRTLTLDAAEIMGVGDRIGSLEAGKDADILILNGDPLHYATFVTTAVVNGEVVYEKGNEALFGHIER